MRAICTEVGPVVRSNVAALTSSVPIPSRPDHRQRTRYGVVAHEFDRRLHETLGLCIFALVALRVVWRTLDDPGLVSVSDVEARVATSVRGASTGGGTS